jgi:large subunit ribosomal protein L22
MYQASARYVRVSVKKSVRIVDLVQKKYVNDALNCLAFTPTKPARIIEKLLKAAVANAQNQDKKLDANKLWVKELRLGTGPHLRRFQPKSMGRAGRIRKPLSHLTVVIEVKG